MRVKILSFFLLLSSSLLLSTVVCDPNHHHSNHNELYTSESTVEILKSETNDGFEIPVVEENDPTIEIGSSNDSSENIGIGLIVGIKVCTVLFFIGLYWVIRKCCCNKKTTDEVIMMQSNTVETQQPGPAAPSKVIQQPIIQQQAPRPQAPPPQWNQPPPQGPPQGVPQWAPHPMGQQQHYSPNAGFNQPPPAYNTGKY